MRHFFVDMSFVYHLFYKLITHTGHNGQTAHESEFINRDSVSALATDAERRFKGESLSFLDICNALRRVDGQIVSGCALLICEKFSVSVRYSSYSVGVCTKR